MGDCKTDNNDPKEGTDDEFRNNTQHKPEFISNDAIRHSKQPNQQFVSAKKIQNDNTENNASEACDDTYTNNNIINTLHCQ